MSANDPTRQRIADPTQARPGPEPEARLLDSVLVAAPDPDMRLYLRLGLAGLAGEVLEAADGWEALDRLAERRVDLVIAERRMPRLDALELARELAPRHTPLLLLGEPPAPGAGVAAVLERPFERRQLRLRVREALAAATDFSSLEEVR